MRISAIGTSASAPQNTGFTLVEILVAITIVGLMSAAVVLTMPLGRDPAHIEAKRFMARTALAAQDSILTNVPTGLAIDMSGYRFFQYRRGGWTPIDGEGAMGPVQWDKGIKASVVNATSEFKVGPAENGVQPSAQPFIVFSPTGLTTPFALSVRGLKTRYVIDVDAFGGISMALDPDERS